MKISKWKLNSQLTKNAKLLRKNMTKEERRLWHGFLKFYKVRFLRQKVIGNYIVDFYCAQARLVIELDGSQHYEDKAVEYDSERSEFLNSKGIEVVRIPNNQVTENFYGVCEYIDNLVRGRIT